MRVDAMPMKTMNPPIRVLLVEDNPGDADLVRISLDDADAPSFEVDVASRLSEALDFVQGPRRPDVVLLDLTLPDASGLDGLYRLNAAAPELPVVVLTGADASLGAAAIQAGAQDYLLKGVADGAVVPRALRYAIERHEHAAAARILASERASRAAAEAARERMALLAAASSAVSHSLDERHALQSLASALVPRFADWVAVRISDAEPDDRGWLAVHVDAASASGVANRLASLEPYDLVGGPAACSSVQSELYDHVLDSCSSSPWRTALGELGARSAMVVPVRLNDDLLGAMIFTALDGSFGQDDRVLAEEIGRRAGVAVANCRLYREARLAILARNEFLSVAAHELRTPLAALQLKLQHVAKKQQESVCGSCERAVPADYVGAARQVTRLGDLVESLLDVSRIESRSAELDREDLDLRDVADEALARFGQQASRPGAEVVLRCINPVRGAWDRLALERVLVNLLSNALKFGGGKPIDLRIGRDGEDAIIEVEDRGIGIASEDCERIFAQFERAVSSRHFGGLGLGLYITRRLVEQHGGQITVASTPGKGSVFTVRLPIAANAATSSRR